MKKLLLIPGVAITALASACAAPLGKLEQTLIGQWCDGNQNTVFSPYSIAVVLAMTAEGSKGTTLDEIDAALVSDGGGRDSFKQEAFPRLSTESGLELAVANALFPQRDFELVPEFTDRIAREYDGTARGLDYRRRTEHARRKINGWVEEKTRGRIEDLIAPGVLTPATRLTLVNAVYFKGLWREKFDPRQTVDKPFETGDGSRRDVPMMQRRGQIRYGDLKTVKAVELPYQGGQLALLVLLPHDRELSSAADALRGGFISEWPSQSRHREVILELPRFKITWENECSAAIRQAGVTTVFDTMRADLSGIAGRPGELSLSAVVHKAFIEVNEEGTEAAAATAGMIRMTSLIEPEAPAMFKANRPFVYAIYHIETGRILFAGAVVNP